MAEPTTSAKPRSVFPYGLMRTEHHGQAGRAWLQTSADAMQTSLIP